MHNRNFLFIKTHFKPDVSRKLIQETLLRTKNQVLKACFLEQ